MTQPTQRAASVAPEGGAGAAPLLAAFDAVDAAVPADSSAEAQLIATKAKALMVGYHARWSNQEWRSIAVEQTVRLPVINPETGRISRTWSQAGKHDGIVTGYGRTALLEHKSASEEIADPSSPYWRRLAIDGQVSQYVLQAWQSGARLDSTLYDVIRKPSIRPKLIAKAERQRIALTGRYCDHAVSEESLAHLAKADSEDLPLYGLRLAAEVLAEPQRYYQRRAVPRLDDDLAEYAGELWVIGQEIQRALRLGLHFRNPAACMTYGTPCEFLSVCSGYEQLEHNNRWERVSDVHPELDGLDTDGRDVLTHSRIKCFQTCRRKHLHRYVEGWRRRDDEEREALYFGTVLHLALEAWWKEQSTAAFAAEGETDAVNGTSYPVNAAD